jgi:hypothetical protein
LKITDILPQLALLITQARLKRKAELWITLHEALAVRAQMGSFQLKGDASGITFTALVNRDVLAKLTPKLRKASSEQRFADCRQEVIEIIRGKLKAGDLKQGNVLYINTADLHP